LAYRTYRRLRNHFYWVLCLACAAGAEEDIADSTSQEGISASVKAQLTATTDQTVDVVKWLSKRRQLTFNGVPYGFTGLPFLYISPNRDSEWNYGFHIRWRDYRRRPYRYRLTLRVLQSTQGKVSNSLRLKVPNISGTGWGVQLLLENKHTLTARYYGLGNNSQYNERLTRESDPDFIDEDYYRYRLEAPRFLVRLLRDIYDPVSMSVGLGLERTEVDKAGQRAFFAEAGVPDGVKDGTTGFVSLTMQWDSRDDDIIPKNGVFHEWSYETSRSSLLSLFFEEIDFRRYTFTDTRYWQLSDRLFAANRAIFEVLSGSVPLYAYGELGGSRRIKGLGGSDLLRGFDKQRFVDDVRFASNSELRYLFHSMTLYRQYLEWNAAIFVDSGRVWPDIGDVTPKAMHWTAGGGLRLYWDEDFVIRADIGISAEQTYYGLKVRNIF
jgi:hypothetical protein